MSKMMNSINPEIIGENKTEKGDVKITTIEPETIDIPNYQYGNGQNSLDAELALRNIPTGGGQYYCGTGSRTTGDGIGTQAITGVGFIPKLITIQAVYSSSEGSYSNGQASVVGNDFAIHQYNTNAGYYTGYSYESGKIIYMQDFNGNTARANIDSIDTDGFTLDWTVISFDTNFMFQCYA